MITAENITPEQIVALQEDPSTDLKLWVICSIALDSNPEGNPVPPEQRATFTQKARERCATILNARAEAANVGR